MKKKHNKFISTINEQSKQSTSTKNLKHHIIIPKPQKCKSNKPKKIISQDQSKKVVQSTGSAFTDKTLDNIIVKFNLSKIDKL